MPLTPIVRRGATAATVITILIAALWARETLVWRDDAYWRLIEGYERAQLIGRDPDAKSPGSFPDRWHAAVHLQGGVAATIEALDTLNPRATVTYSNAPEVHDLYEPRDYTTLIDLRIDGTSVYVMRAIELITSERRITQFDLTLRKVTADRRVYRGDLKSASDD